MRQTGRVFIPLLVAAGFAGSAYGDEAHQLGAHVHGHGEAAIALDGAMLTAELTAPLNNVAGFEHAPETDEERQALESGIEKLRAGASLFAFNAEAACELTDASVTAPDFGAGNEHHDHAEDHDHEHDEDHEHHAHEDGHEHEGSHADIRATYKFECGASDALTGFSTALFESLPRFESLEVTFLSDAVQRYGELTPDSARFDIE
mgnify:CR=1 FL=1